MKIFLQKSFLQKIIGILIVLIIFSFIAPNYMGLVSKADKEIQEFESTEMDDDDSISGIIISPFIGLVNLLADSVASLFQTFMVGDAGAVMTSDVSSYAKVSDDEKTESTKRANIVINKDYGGTTQYPNFAFSCEEIFANKVPMLDINFLNPSVTDINGNSDGNIALQLQGVIKSWYKVLRLIAIAGLLSVLIYMGIRIMIDSNTENKAKYKERLQDWLVAFVILFSLHYIMSFTLYVSDSLTNLFNNGGDTRSLVVYYNQTDTYFKTNLIGLARFKVQNDGMISKVSYEIVYIALLAFTVKFTIVYLKRVLNMAFLTLISPLIALMYPIDKIKDGSAQSFSMWLKEYVFNALLQPLHYLIYTVLITSAISLAANNPIYAIAALLFMTQAEKFMKSVFGFDKAGGGMVGGMSAVTTAVVASNIASVMKNARGSNNKGQGKNNEVQGGKPPTMLKDANIENLNDGGNGGNTSTETEPNTADMPAPPDDSQEDGQQTEGQQFNAQQASGQQDGEQPPVDGQQVDEQQGDGQQVDEQQANEQQANEQVDTPKDETQTGSSNYQHVDLADSVKKPKKPKKPRNKHIGRTILGAAGTVAKTAGTVTKTAGRAYVKAGAGLMAAALELGVSVTDGKFNPKESVASAFAGAKGAGAAMDNISGGVRNVANSASRYAASFLHGNDYVAFKSYQRKWNKDSNVEQNFKDTYGDNYKEYRDFASNQLLTRGVTDFQEQKQCIKYADNIKADMVKDWEENEKAAIRQENAGYTDEQVDAEFETRKAEQAEKIRSELKTSKSKMSDNEAIGTAMRNKAIQEAVTVMKFRKKAAAKDALLDSDKRAKFAEQQAKAIRSNNPQMSKKQAKDVVNNAYSKVDKFDAINDL